MERFSNINSILAFVTVAREGSVPRAADVLNLTQPAVSHQLKRLSEETGIVLFHRTPKGLQISHDGAALLSKAEHIHDSHEADGIAVVYACTHLVIAVSAGSFTAP